MRLTRPAAVMTALLTMLSLLLLSGCGSTDTSAPGPGKPQDGPVVVASTSWAGAFAKAAGAKNISLVVPASVLHAPDYDPKPTDLAKVASADYVLYAPFDSFATRLHDAAGGHGKTVQLNLENTPATIHSEVTRLGKMFGTSAQASAWLANFDKRYAELSKQTKDAVPQPVPAAVAQAFMAYWGNFAGLPVKGTFGPEPVTASKLAQLSAVHPAVVLGNAHIPDNPEIPGARTVDLINFPGADLNLLTVFEENSRRITAAVKG